MNDLAQRAYFFDAGIRFGCQRCGACCTGAPGIVRVDKKELAAIAAHLGKPAALVADAYLMDWKDGYRVKEAPDGRCFFFDAGCRIYPERPSQCRTFPFWFRLLRSEAGWQRIQRECPGIGKGRHHTKNEILEILTAQLSPANGDAGTGDGHGGQR
jgi:Fe-S-cluster containining protein